MSIWIIDGNIGCGKTTLLNYIEQTYSDSIVLREPLNDWQPFLEKFYNDPKKYSYEFQKYILKYHISIKDTIKSFNGKYKNIFIERSFLSCLFVFGQELVNEGNLSEKQQEFLTLYFDQYGWFPNGFIYLDCSPDICYERIHKRNRNSEELISMDYLTKINNHYKNVYNNLKNKTFSNSIIDLNKYDFQIKFLDASKDTLEVNSMFDNLITS
jgi:deoxyadenosine/deoxycytidine kinase